MTKKKSVRKVTVAKPKGQPAFESDHRKDKPRLHRLYVEWAVRHLALMDQVISAFDAQSNFNVLDVTIAVMDERAKLIKVNAAYAEADKLIQIFKSVRPL